MLIVNTNKDYKAPCLLKKTQIHINGKHRIFNIYPAHYRISLVNVNGLIEPAGSRLPALLSNIFQEKHKVATGTVR